MPRTRFLRRSMLLMTSTPTIVAIVLALAVGGALAFRFLEKPRLVRIAVGPDAEDQSFAQALKTNMPRGFESSRIAVVRADTREGAAAALDADKAGLAIVRSDVAVPKDAGAMLVVHRDAVLFLAPPDAKLDEIADLATKKVGILPGGPDNSALLDTLLEHYGIATDTIEHVALQDADMKTALSSKRVDAVMVVAPLASKRLADAVEAASGEGDASATLFGLKNIEGLTQDEPGLSKTSVPAGLFAGAPPKPDDDIETVDVASILVAAYGLSEAAVDQLTRSIFEMRRVLLESAPIARFMESAETEKGATIALHPGATTYYQDTEKTFMDRYGDWFYIMAMVAGGGGSAIASLLSAFQARSRRSAMAVIDQLANLRRRTAECADRSTLRAYDGEVSEIALKSLTRAREGRIDQAGLEILRLAVEETRRAIRERRTELSTQALTPPAQS